ncbi:hypothetical protein MASR2M117_03110 [Paludibacter sp.]
MKTHLHKIAISFVAALFICTNILADNTLNQARVYINPGHGGWGANDRPLATINYAILDTLGFFETNTDLVKGLSLRDELISAGVGYVRMSRTKNGIAPASQSSLNQYEVYEGNGQLSTLSVIAADVETNNMDYFISIHSNAATEGTSTNYPLLLYRGTDTEPGNGLTQARNMARDAWKHIAKNGVTYYSSYTGPNDNNSRGDISFYGSSGTTAGYTGYLGVLRHGCDGYLSEGCFHTYQPERHRLLNKDYCKQEGVRYSRAIRAWFGDNTESKGYIMGTVKDKNQALTHNLYNYKIGSFDQYKPLNEVTVTLQDLNNNVIGTYTTDKEYNGVYVFGKLIPGKYKLVYDIPGYWKETNEIEVKANETSFINKLLTDLEHEDPNIVTEVVIPEVLDFPHPVQDGDIAAANTYQFEKEKEFTIAALEGLTVRRVLLRNNKYYILAVDAQKDPKLLVINPSTGELIKEMSTEGISTEGFNGKKHLYNLSDIAFTQDNVLIGVNSTVVGKESNSFQRGDFFVYKWQANDSTVLEDVKPQIFLTLPTNTSASLAAAGNNNSNLMANSFTVTGTTAKLVIFFDSHPSDNWNAGSNWSVRYVAWKVENGVVVGTQYNNSGYTVATGLGEDSQITLSPTALDRFIADGNNIKAMEFEFNWVSNTINKVGDFSAPISNASMGNNSFRYTNKIYTAVPVSVKSPTELYSYQLHLYDITDGVENAIKVGNTTSDINDEIALSKMFGIGTVDNADINLHCLVGNKVVLYSTKSAVQQASSARAFAYNLSSEYNDANKVYKIRYSLNTDVNSVTIKIKDSVTGDLLKTLNPELISKGTHEISLDKAELPDAGEFDWSVEVAAPNVTRFTKLSDDNMLYKYFAPKGIAIDKSPESKYFGRIYVTNTAAGTAAARPTTTGIYVLSPVASDITLQGDNAYNGGITWTGVNGEGPRKLTVTNDGRIFIADASATNAGIYYMNPETFAASTLFPGSTVTAGAVKIGSTQVSGQIVAIGSRGSGASTQLYAVDKSITGTSAWKKLINVYNIGTDNTWTKAPSSSSSASSFIGNDNSSIIPVATGYWGGQYRGAGSNTTANPCMFYYSDSFKEAVFNTAEFKDKNGATITLDKPSQNGGLAVDEARGLIALSYDGGVYIFEYKLNKDGVPVVNPKFRHNLGVASVTYDDFAFDYAGNLYAASNSGKFISVWSMPTDKNICITPASKANRLSPVGSVGTDKIEVQTRIYPNPAQDYITIEQSSTIQNVQIYDLSGKIILNKDKVENTSTTIDVSTLQSGVYMIKVNDGRGVRVVKK